MSRIAGTEVAAGALALALLSACSTGAPPPRVPLQDAEALTRAALAATRMGAGVEVRSNGNGQVALLHAGAAPAAAPLPELPPAAAPAVTAQVTIPPIIGKPPPPAPAAPAADRNQEVQQMLLAWRLAWELGDFGNYVRFYDPAFKGDAPSRQQWEKQRRARLANARIGLRMDNVRTTLLSDEEAEVQFVQHYSSGRHADVGDKRMKLRRVNGAWRITQESWTPRR